MAGTFDLRLLGTPTLTDAQGPRALPGRRALALLAVVAVDGAQTRARLAEMFWGELDDASARRNLRRELARLREAGLEALLDVAPDSVAPGPMLRPDVAAFEAALARGELEPALAAWPGPQAPLMAGFTLGNAPGFDGWLADRRDAFARRWHDAADALATAREARGDLRGALDLRLRMVEADPLLEPPVAHAMRLHERLGERAAALELFERCSSALAQELGLQPLSTTVELADRIRASDRVAPLLARDAAAIGAAAFDAPLVGREAEAAHIRTSAAPVLLVLGDAGVGKTRLVQECLAASTTAVLQASAHTSASALQPVARALAEALRRGPTAARLMGLPADTRREAARLVPALAADARPDDRADLAAQRRFFDALGDALDTLAGPAGTLLIDDLHWADEATFALLRHLAHRRARQPWVHARIVATARDTELEARAGARDTLRLLEREGLLERLPLTPLTPAQTLALVRALSGSADAEDAGTLFAARLQRATAGNPFFLLETLRFLFAAGELGIDERGRWRTRYDEATADYAELPVPPSVGRTVCERVERLGEPARRVLEAAALAGDGFSLAEVQPATALTEWDALAGLEHALAAQLIAPEQTGAAADGAAPERRRHLRYRFAHDLARAALDAELGPERRRRVHARLAQVYAAHEWRPDRRPERLAFHLEGAGDRAAAVPWRLRAAARAQATFAVRDALAQLALALADGPSPQQEFDARDLRAKLLRREGEDAARSTELEHLETLAAALGTAAAQRRVLLHHGVRHVDHGRPLQALASCEQALALPGGTDAETLHALRIGGFAALQADRGDTAESWLARAAALATRLQANERWDIQAHLIHLRVSAGRADDAAGLAEAALAEPGTPLAPDDRAAVVNAAMRAFEAIGQHARALACVDEAITLARRTGDPHGLLNYLGNRMRLLLSAGDLAAARATLQELLAAGPAPARYHYAVLLRQAQLQAAEGEAAAALATLDRAIGSIPQADFSLYGNGFVLRARWLALSREFERARAAADDAARAHGASAERPLIVAEAVRAWCELAGGQAGAARQRLQAALAGPSTLDEFWNEHQQLARCVCAAACAAEGGSAAVLALLDGVGLTPALRAMAAAVRLAADGDAGAARAAIGPAPPLERALIRRALEGLPPLA